MKSITMLKNDGVQFLKIKVVEHQQLYMNGDFAKFENDSRLIFKVDEFKFDEDSISQLLISDDPKMDAQNAYLLHESLKGLPLNIAREEKFWGALSHFNRHCLNYIRVRWPIPEKQAKFRSYVQEKFMGGNNNRVRHTRHALSRLWWYANSVRSTDLKNYKEMLEFFLSKQDIANQIIERPRLSTNPTLRQSIIESLFARKDEKIERSTIRKFMALLNFKGGDLLLPTLSLSDCREIVEVAFMQSLKEDKT